MIGPIFSKKELVERLQMIISDMSADLDQLDTKYPRHRGESLRRYEDRLHKLGLTKIRFMTFCQKELANL